MSKISTSVVIACHNCEKTIDNCLKSVLINNPDEIIVVNDCSTDNSLKIIKKYPVRIINLKKKSGVAKAEKIGIKKAKGDIIFLTNSDIVVPPNWIKKHLELHKKADCVGGWLRYDVKNMFQKLIHVSETNTLPAYNCSFKRKVLENIGNIDESLSNGSEDTEFFLRAKFAGYKIIADSSIPVFHYHNLGGYKNEILKSWSYGYRLGKIIRRYKHGKLMNKWFLLLPIYWIFIFLRDIKTLLREFFLKLVESVGKFIGFIIG